MQGTPNIRPIGDNILVERLEGHGIERVTAGGIVIPATLEAKAKTKNDAFRARILAIGDGPGALEVRKAFDEGFGHVLVHAWCEHGERGLYTGKPLDRNRLFIKPDDIIVALAEDAQVVAKNSDAERR